MMYGGHEELVCVWGGCRGNKGKNREHDISGKKATFCYQRLRFRSGSSDIRLDFMSCAAEHKPEQAVPALQLQRMFYYSSHGEQAECRRRRSVPSPYWSTFPSWEQSGDERRKKAFGGWCWCSAPEEAAHLARHSRGVRG